MSTKRMMSVYIGRFSPFHNGHAEVLKQTFDNSEHVLILIGSSNSPRTIKDPWSFSERKSMIMDYLKSQKLNLNSFLIEPLEDEPYNDQAWVENVLTIVDKFSRLFNGNYKNVFLTGSKRDWTSYYLEMFPTLQKGFIQENERTNFSLNATDVRKKYFSDKSFIQPELNEVLPRTTSDFLVNFKVTEHYAQ